ncbi:cyclic nucleotide-binding protein [Sphingomonas metalli]|uniref:Cyclic nucleotide-binding protein n=1 Tax=Sphingomonas metalli TaxID=1779358 RepID=A0A916TAD1_9SPHN|nr:Crp/Fnr family transcriptional regulator [Sphingomonas metalli]GGB36325.1 cyclic nucleotide-binding protein [Sphingomonas metalli]
MTVGGTDRGIGLEQAGNVLLRALPPSAFALLSPHLERAAFSVDDVLAEAGEPITTIFFPEGGIAALLDPVEEGPRRLAVGLVGREGFVGWPALMGDDRWPHDVMLRAEAGTLLRIDAARLSALAEENEVLRTALLRFVHVATIQMGRTIVSSLIHPVERRMARWILLYHDRLSSDEICLTHEEFRLMLGVRRSSVTEALHRLEADHAVRALRGRVIVRDRDKLAALAGDTYGHAEREYRRLIADLNEPDARRRA